MEPSEVVHTFADAFNKGDYDAVAPLLSEDFEFSGPVPEPLSAEEWLGFSRILKAAFPDIQYNLRVESVNGKVVKTSSQVSGTHTGDLDMSAMGMGVIPATGKSFSNPEEYGFATVEGDKITSIRIDSVEGSGVPGILAKIGVQPPVG
ncbi:MAG: DUF4440 domain-containing protein [Anaerolineales bacterium]|nr:DUF4440 domain-containing protein [Anaerolineales bacterium]